MTEKSMTRREVLRFLGIEIPVLLVATQILTSEAAGETIKKTYKTDWQQFLDLVNNRNIYFGLSPVYDEKRKVYGMKIEEIPPEVSSLADPKGVDLHNATVWSINERTMQEWSEESIDDTFAWVRQVVEDGQPLVLDLAIDGKSYQYVIKYD